MEASAEARSWDSGSVPSSMISARVSDAWGFFVEREGTRGSRLLDSKSLLADWVCGRGLSSGSGKTFVRSAVATLGGCDAG